jgi:hypothetical protein
MTAIIRHAAAAARRAPATRYQDRDGRSGPVAAPIRGSVVWIMVHPRPISASC